MGRLISVCPRGVSQSKTIFCPKKITNDRVFESSLLLYLSVIKVTLAGIIDIRFPRYVKGDFI